MWHQKGATYLSQNRFFSHNFWTKIDDVLLILLAIGIFVWAQALSELLLYVQAGLAMSDNCLIQKIEPCSEVKFKIPNM